MDISPQSSNQNNSVSSVPPWFKNSCAVFINHGDTENTERNFSNALVP